MARYQLYVNGEFASEHRGGYSRSRVDITGLLQEGENTLFLMVDSTEDRQIPPFGYTIDYMCFGGIYRDVNVIFTESAYISDVLLRYDLEGTTAQLYPEIQLDNAAEAFRAPGRGGDSGPGGKLRTPLRNPGGLLRRVFQPGFG